jgi:hypothetical protein
LDTLAFAEPRVTLPVPRAARFDLAAGAWLAARGFAALARWLAARGFAALAADFAAGFLAVVGLRAAVRAALVFFDVD